jgi:hypothetical protein
MADVNVSVTVDRTPTIVVIVLHRITGPAEDTDISSDLRDFQKRL